MAEIPSNIVKILDNEVDFQKNLSEQLLNKFGATINGLVDRLDITIFTSSGTYDIPLNVTHLLIGACGGGGGGASGRKGASTGDHISQRGGDGCRFVFNMTPVVASEQATITIGAGGLGASGGSGNGFSGIAGGDGGDTLFTTPSNGTVTWFGGKGGAAATSNDRWYDVRRRAQYHTLGGFYYGNQFSGNRFQVQAEAGLYAGGLVGGTGGSAGNGGGGGGGGDFGVGTDGTSGGLSTSASAQDVAATSYGSGGGASGSATNGSGNGGDGGQGILIIFGAR